MITTVTLDLIHRARNHHINSNSTKAANKDQRMTIGRKMNSDSNNNVV